MRNKIDELIEGHKYTDKLRMLGYTDDDLNLIKLFVPDSTYPDDPDYEKLKMTPELWPVSFSKKVTAATKELEIAYGRMKWAMSSINESQALQRNRIFKELELYELNLIQQNPKKGGEAKASRYAPLKEEALKLVRSKNPPYKSRRNAAMSIAPKIIEKSQELGVYLSPDQSVITISGWLKEAQIVFASKRNTSS